MLLQSIDAQGQTGAVLRLALQNIIKGQPYIKFARTRLSVPLHRSFLDSALLAR